MYIKPTNFRTICLSVCLQKMNNLTPNRIVITTTILSCPQQKNRIIMSNMDLCDLELSNKDNKEEQETRTNVDRNCIQSNFWISRTMKKESWRKWVKLTELDPMSHIMSLMVWKFLNQSGLMENKHLWKEERDMIVLITNIWIFIFLSIPILASSISENVKPNQCGKHTPLHKLKGWRQL